MSIKIDEITRIITEQIRDYEMKALEVDVGEVVSVGDGIAIIYGLRDVMLSELLLFSNDTYGIVFSIEEDHVGAILLGSDKGIREGEKVRRTRRVMDVPVGDGFLGRVVDPLGFPLDGRGDIEEAGRVPIEARAPGVIDREPVSEPLETGLKIIDALTPIGRGQRELIIGDRQTGKTAIAIDAIINQKGKGVYCIYVAIGQKASNVAAVVDKLFVHGAMDYTIVVNATAADAAAIQFLAPYSATAMAEYFRDLGRHVLIVYDDLSKHAAAYRQISLLLKRPPGREAYPGDIFYLHSRLLERSAKLKKESGGGSITALPIVETKGGDITAYVPTNIISITDGQIYLEPDLFYAGIRPAVNVGLSVSRVGGAAQRHAMKKIASLLRLELAQYRELESFAQFGAELDERARAAIAKGRILVEVLKQRQYRPIRVGLQVVELFAALHGFLDGVPRNEILSVIGRLESYIQENHLPLLDELEEGEFGKEKETKIRDVLSGFNWGV